MVFRVTRPTIYDVPDGASLEERMALIPDAGRRRHLSFEFDFDTRAETLKTVIGDDWEPHVKEMWQNNQADIRAGLIHEFGERSIEKKVENFVAIGSKPMSVLAYHNAFFQQVRSAYVMGQHYPALVGACALGERILNHLILDMRDFFRASPQYKHVYRKQSFDDWAVPIDTLEAWDILLPEAVAEFKALKTLRHRSIHFNVSTYETLQEDALAAVLHMREIIDRQFGTWGARPWFIPDTMGHSFVARDYEQHPFVQTYFLPRFPFVGTLFGMKPGPQGWSFFDVPDYGDGEMTDAEFAAAYNDRNPADVLTDRPEIERVDTSTDPK